MLGTEGKGAYSVALRAAGVIAALAQWGVPEVLLSYVNRPEHPARSLAGTTQVIAIGSGVLALLLLPALYLAFTDSAFRGVELPLLTVAVASTAFSLSFQFSSRVIQLQGDLVAYNALTVLRAGALCLLTAIVFLPVSEPIKMAMYAYVGAEMLAALVSVGVLLRRNGWPWSFNRSLAKTVARAGNSVQLGMIAAFLAAEIGVFIVNSMVGLEAVGWYTTGLGLARWTLFVSLATRVVLQTELAQFGDQSSDIAEITGLRVPPHAAVAPCRGAHAPSGGPGGIILLYGQGFLPSYEPLVVALPCVVAHGITQLLSGYFVSVKRFGTPSLVAWFNLILASLLQITLIQWLGITGASAGLSIAYVLGACIMAALYLKHSRSPVAALIPGWREIGWYAQLVKHGVTRSRGPTADGV